MDAIERGKLYFLDDIARKLGYKDDSRLRELVYRKKLRAKKLGSSYLVLGDDIFKFCDDDIAE